MNATGWRWVRSTSARISGVEEPPVQRVHVVVVDLAGQPERRRAGSPPPARRLAGRVRVEVVVLPALRDLVGQVPGVVAGRDAEHVRPPVSTGPRCARPGEPWPPRAA